MSPCRGGDAALSASTPNNSQNQRAPIRSAILIVTIFHFSMGMSHILLSQQLNIWRNQTVNYWYFPPHKALHIQHSSAKQIRDIKEHYVQNTSMWEALCKESSTKNITEVIKIDSHDKPTTEDAVRSWGISTGAVELNLIPAWTLCSKPISSQQKSLRLYGETAFSFPFEAPTVIPCVSTDSMWEIFHIMNRRPWWGSRRVFVFLKEQHRPQTRWLVL